MKPIIAITAAVAFAAATVANAGQKIDINTKNVSDEAILSAVAYLDKADEKLAETHFGALIASLGVDDVELSLDVQVLLAQVSDSTSRHIYNPAAVGGCYANCYGNCHGSRSWR